MVDDVSIDEWLELSTDERIFRATVEPNTLDVICPVPSCVKDILEPALVHRKRDIFRDTFDRLVRRSKPGELAEVVTLYETALDKYQGIQGELEEGMEF